MTTLFTGLSIGVFIGVAIGIGIMAIVSMGKTLDEPIDEGCPDDTHRMDFLANGYSITYRNGLWGVVAGIEPKVVGVVHDCPRKAIDSARFDTEEVNG